MKEIKFIAVANIESSVALRIDGKESVAGHVWIKYLNLETGEIKNYGYELDGSNPFYDNGKVTHYDDELYLGKSFYSTPFYFDANEGEKSIKYWNDLEKDPGTYSVIWNSCVDKVIESLEVAGVSFVGLGDGNFMPMNNIFPLALMSQRQIQNTEKLLADNEVEKLKILSEIFIKNSIKDDDFKHLAKLPLKELQIFHEEFLLIEQERAKILEKHKELGVIGISNVLKMNLEQLKQFEKATEQFALYDPIALDLNGNGKIDTLSLENGVFFDHNGDKIAFKSSWVSSSDGILARDINGDGKITSGAELFGNFTRLKMAS